MHPSSAEKLLWPEKRLGRSSIYRNTEVSWLKLLTSSLPSVLLPALERNALLTSDGQIAVLGPIPKGTPINLLANISLFSETHAAAGATQIRTNFSQYTAVEFQSAICS
jgi:hypothetical protein